MLVKLIVPLFFVFLLVDCSQTEVIESPKTGYAVETGEAKEPEIIWTSRGDTHRFDYLGQLKVRSWTYDGAVERLREAGKSLRADAIIDVHFERIGFLTSLHGFAIKYR